LNQEVRPPNSAIVINARENIVVCDAHEVGRVLGYISVIVIKSYFASQREAENPKLQGKSEDRDGLGAFFQPPLTAMAATFDN